MPVSGTALKLRLSVLKAKYLQKKGYLREQYDKLQKLRTNIGRIEKTLDDNEDGRSSSSFSSGSPLLPASDSDGESGKEIGKDQQGDKDPEPKVSTPRPKGAQPSKATPPPPKSGTRVSDLRPPPKKPGGSLAKPPPVPASGSGVKHPPKVKAGAQTAKAAARRDPEAPNHMGHPNAAGELYPGFPVGHPKRCEACDQLRRGFLRFTKGHRKPVCEWAPLQAKRQS